VLLLLGIYISSFIYLLVLYFLLLIPLTFISISILETLAYKNYSNRNFLLIRLIV